MEQKDKFIGIQIGAISVLDEGPEHVMDVVEENAKVNVLIVSTTGYALPANLPPEGYVDHGKGVRKPAPTDRYTGNWAKVYPEYYGGTMLTDFRVREPEFRDVDILNLITGPAHKRGMQVYSWLRENPTRDEIVQIPNLPKVLEADIYGRVAFEPCVNHPDYRNWWLSQIEDQMKSYPIDGFLFNVERRGPLGEALSRLWGAKMRPSIPTCFCEHCRAVGRERGINVERARVGMEEIWAFAQSTSRGETPVDGYLVTLLRLMLRYPEVLAWNQIWVDGMDSLRAELYGATKAINPAVKMGFHIYHENTFSPLCRAENDYAKFAKFSDYLKPVVYNVCAGIRFADYVRRLNDFVFKDLEVHQVLRLVYAIMGWDEAGLEELPEKGFSADYVQREIERVVKATNHAVPIYSGIDMDVPTGHRGREATVGDIEASTLASFRGGADGLIISRCYCEITNEHLAAVGRALDLLGIK